jgi:hypothetical protein
MRKRDPRHQTLLVARMRAEGAWTDVQVRNISRRGMLLSTDQTLARGTCIELRRAHYTIIGRVVWSQTGHVGVFTQNPLDIPGLLTISRGGAVPRPEASEPGQKPWSPDQSDRRATPRAPDRAGNSERFSSWIQFGALGLAAVLAATFIATEVGEKLAAPFRIASAAVDGPVAPPQ